MRMVMMLTALAGTTLAGTLMAQTITDLQATCRSGQVFLTWQEHDLPADALLTVHGHHEPITADNLPAVLVLASHVHRGSARDWWQDPQSFNLKAEPAEPKGFVIAPGTAALAPDSGLHVHTVAAATAGQRYYAVTWSGSQTIVPGANSLTRPCLAEVGQPNPIWQATTPVPQPRSASGKALIIALHGRGGGITAGPKAQPANCLWFGNRDQGWREGLPVKFNLSSTDDAVTLTLHDRVWANRPVRESTDGRDHCPAISTWWFGYNRNLPITTDTPEIIGSNYTQRYILALIQWAQNWLGTDPSQTYLTGGSMGGSGAVALALHYPDVFAAVLAHVPVYSYTWDTCSTSQAATAGRIACPMGPLKNRTAKLLDGTDLLRHLDGARNISVQTDTPPIFATNGRGDASIPWINNPPFYRAANNARQAFAVYWNDGAHGMSSSAPADVKNWSTQFRKYRLNQPFPAFSNGSDNRDFGDGNPEDGDREGWLNRGLDWHSVTDQPNRLAMTITANYPDITYPVTVDVTPRRIQAFKAIPGETLLLQLNQDQPVTYTVPANGLLTVTSLKINTPEGTSFAFTKP